MRHKSRYSLIFSAILMSIAALCFAQLGGGVGQEMKQIEKQISDPTLDAGYQRQSAPPKISIKEASEKGSDASTEITSRPVQKRSFFRRLFFWKKEKPESEPARKSIAPRVYVPEYAVTDQEKPTKVKAKKSRTKEPLTMVTPVYDTVDEKSGSESRADRKTSTEVIIVKPEYPQKAAMEVAGADTKKTDKPVKLAAVKPVYEKEEPKEIARVEKRRAPEKLPVVTPVYAKVTSDDVPVISAAEPAREAEAPPPVKPVYAKSELIADHLDPVEAVIPLTVERDEVRLPEVQLTLKGDGALLEDAGMINQLKLDLANIVSDPELSSEDKQASVKVTIEECNKKLIEAGYYLTSLWLLDADMEQAEFSVFVDAGRIRETKFYDAMADGDAAKKDFSQKYFSEKQLRKKMTNIQEGQVFNYNDFRSDIFSINSHPDVMLDADLRVKKEIVDGKLRRYVDTDYMVKETLPLHAVLSLDNSGTDATGNWGAGLTVQHLNLTKHDDVLSVNIPISIDRSLKSASSSYFLPYSWGNGGAYTLYGGYSEMYTEDIIKDFDEKGKGYFAGVQISHKLMPNSKKHSLDVAAGITYRDLTTTTYFMGTALPEREITMVPLALTFSYSSLQPGFLGGRNFFTAQTIYHRPGFLGSSNDDEFEQQRPSADSEYWIEKIQAARIQPLFGKKNSDGSMRDQWLLFLKGDAQISSGTLVPAEQMGIGGASTVRGYKERVNLGDNAFVGTAELRTPLLLGMISSPFLSEEQKAKRELDPVDYLQFITFFDYGYVEYADPQPGELANDSIYSVGVGVRMSLTKHSQLSFDYGFPLVTTQDDDSKSGRFHLNVKIQF